MYPPTPLHPVALMAAVLYLALPLSTGGAPQCDPISGHVPLPKRADVLTIW